MSIPKPSNLFNVLSELSEPLLSDLFEHASWHRIRDGEALFRAGDVGNGCYRIQSGLVKIVVASQQGEERILSLLGPEDIVGELSMIDGRPRSASVIAIEDSLLSFVSQAKFEKYAKAHPELTSYLVRTLARRLREADDALAAATFLSVKARLARALLSLAEYGGRNNEPARPSCAIKSDRLILRQWLAWREKTSHHERVAQARYHHARVGLLLYQRPGSAGAGNGIAS